MITTEINEEYVAYVHQISEEFSHIYGNWATLFLPNAGEMYCFMCDVENRYNIHYLSMHGEGIFDFNGPTSIYFPFTWRGMKVCLE